MPTDRHGSGARAFAAPGLPCLPFLDVPLRTQDELLVVLALHLEALLGAAQRATGGPGGMVERALRDLVWFVRSTPASATELDRLANAAIAALDQHGAEAVGRLQACRSAVAAFGTAAWARQTQRAAP